jgi:5-methyltetrahydrofolate corrinoid/iron sulfur protein methyltransferase
MILIGESIHVIAGEVSRAIKKRDTEPIQDLVRAQAEAGADYIDLNMGFVRKNTEEIVSWLVNTTREVTDLPLSIDTMNPAAMEVALKICSEDKKRPLLNSASNKTDSKEQMLPLATKYDCDVVLSVIFDQGCPADFDMRVSSILEAVDCASNLGIENERIWVDPIVLPVSTAGEGQTHSTANLEFISALPDMLPDIKSTVGLSNISNGAPVELRPILNRTYLVMLGRNGLYSAIVDVLDEELVRMNRGEMSGIVGLIHKTMDKENIGLGSLSKEERDYVKTTKVLMGETLYSDAWLED